MHTHEYFNTHGHGHRYINMTGHVSQMRIASFAWWSLCPVLWPVMWVCWPPACARIISSRFTPGTKQEGEVLPIISEKVKVDWQNIYWWESSIYFVANWRFEASLNVIKLRKKYSQFFCSPCFLAATARPSSRNTLPASPLSAWPVSAFTIFKTQNIQN